MRTMVYVAGIIGIVGLSCVFIDWESSQDLSAISRIELRIELCESINAEQERCINAQAAAIARLCSDQSVIVKATGSIGAAFGEHLRMEQEKNAEQPKKKRFWQSK